MEKEVKKEYSYFIAFHATFERGEQGFGNTCITSNTKISKDNIRQLEKVVKAKAEQEMLKKVKTLALLSFQRI